MIDKATHTPLPCPFCGAQIEIAKWEGNYGFAHPRQSERCIMEGDFYDYATEAEALTAWNTRAVNSHHDLIEALTDVGASLAAAISLLERGGKAAKKAAPSDRMFDQMVKDYKASLERTRAILTKEAGHG